MKIKDDGFSLCLNPTSENDIIILFPIPMFESHPSLAAHPENKRKKLKFSPSSQHAKNTDSMLQCEEYNKWRLVFSKKKLNKQKLESLNKLLESISYTCGFLFGEF